MLTKNFSEDEMRCRCKKCDGGKMDPEFMNMLQSVRDAYGKSLTVTSGYRCADRNKEEGGVTSSYHLLGKAADLQCVMGADKYKIVRIAMGLGFNGIGIGQTFVHLDNRAVGPTIWTYPHK